MGVKGIAWVGQVYQKFEAMFLEVEEIMYEDTVKYVENQVQNVGASVKKFYSDVMDDLNPPSLSSDEKMDTSDLPDKLYSNVVICKKPSKGMEIRIGCPDARSTKSNEKAKVTVDEPKGEAYTLSLTKPFRDSCSRWGDGSVSEQNDVGFKGSLEKRVAQAENPRGKTSLCEASLRDQLEEATLSIEGTNDEIENAKNVPRDVSSCGDSTTELDGRLDWCDLHQIEIESVPELVPTKLDESCVVISKGEELHSVSHKEAKNRPYRKKIKEAFTSKKRLTRKQEYKRLAGLHGSSSEKGESLTGSVEEETRNLGENDWELL